MDISRAASFERFLFEVLGRNGERIAELMTELETNGRFELTKEEFNKFVVQDSRPAPLITRIVWK